MNPFDFLNIFFEKKKYPSNEEIEKDLNQYILNMTFSCDQQLATLAHELTKLKLTNKMYFDLLYYSMPKCKKFIKYNASKPKKLQDIQYLMEYYKCSQQTAKEYHDIISEDDMKLIRDVYEKRGLK